MTKGNENNLALDRAVLLAHVFAHTAHEVHMWTCVLPSPIPGEMGTAFPSAPAVPEEGSIRERTDLTLGK